MASAKETPKAPNPEPNADEQPEPNPNPEEKPDGHSAELADAAEMASEVERDPLDATSTRFTEEDADERGWIVHREPPVNGVSKYHRVPVKHWPVYEKLHGF